MHCGRFAPWSADALLRVAVKLVQDVPLLFPPPVPMEAGPARSTTSPGATRHCIASALSRMHEQMSKVSEQKQHAPLDVDVVSPEHIQSPLSLVTHVTPRNFLDFVSNFKSILKETSVRVQTHCSRLSRGVSILDGTAAKVAGMRVKLKEAEREVADRIKAVTATRERLAQERKKVDCEAALAATQAKR